MIVDCPGLSEVERIVGWCVMTPERMLFDLLLTTIVATGLGFFVGFALRRSADGR